MLQLTNTPIGVDWDDWSCLRPQEGKDLSQNWLRLWLLCPMEQHIEQLVKQEEDSQMTTQEELRTVLHQELYVVISQSLHNKIKHTYLSLVFRRLREPSEP